MGNNTKQKFILIPIVSLIVIFSLIALFYYKLLHNINFENNIEKFGQLGDFIGGTLNPILAFFAFIALLYTIKLQSDALKISQEELSATREELEKSRIAQEKQSKSLELQNKATKQQIFENTFFQLISIFIELKANFTLHKTEKLVDGSYAAPSSNSQIIKMTFHETIDNCLTEFKNLFDRDYEKFNKSYESLTGNYFAQIYQIIKFIDESNIENKQRYINIFRAQFTNNELELLFYHCLSSIGKRKFKPLIEKYHFFEHITHNQDIEKPLKEYNISAYGDNQQLRDFYNSLS